MLTYSTLTLSARKRPITLPAKLGSRADVLEGVKIGNPSSSKVNRIDSVSAWVGAPLNDPAGSIPALYKSISTILA